jgi:hypothetical protein
MGAWLDRASGLDEPVGEAQGPVFEEPVFCSALAWYEQALLALAARQAVRNLPSKKHGSSWWYSS